MVELPLPVDAKALQKLKTHGKVVLVPVRTKQQGMAFCKVDPVDSYLKTFKWTEAEGGYPRRSTKVQVPDHEEPGAFRWKTQTIYLHKQLAGLQTGNPLYQVHHANHDVLDCRRANLWLCTPAFNLRHQKRSLQSMLQELWATPKERIECWPLGDKRRAIAHLLELHVKKHGSFPLEFVPSNIIDKIPDPPKVIL